MADEIPHDQLIADLAAIGMPEAANIATTDHKHSKVSEKIKTEAGVLVFENGILVKIDK